MIEPKPLEAVRMSNLQVTLLTVTKIGQSFFSKSIHAHQMLQRRKLADQMLSLNWPRWSSFSSTTKSHSISKMRPPTQSPATLSYKYSISIQRSDTTLRRSWRRPLWTKTGVCMRQALLSFSAWMSICWQRVWIPHKKATSQAQLGSLSTGSTMKEPTTS